ncbi:MAG: glycerol-3-phosphate dehydrogenase C-terminal domain-containing protein, partial [Pseudomonadota bacterium]
EIPAGQRHPGGDFGVHEVGAKVDQLRADYPFLTDRWALRLIRAYGTEAWQVMGDAKTAADLGQDFGASLSEAELRWLITREYVTCADDVLWRRSKLGLRMSEAEQAALATWVEDAVKSAQAA